MRLLEFVSLIRPLRGDGPLTRDVNGVAWDCRRVAPGNLFVAIPAPGRDTQAAVDAAVERGATAVLCEGREVVGLRTTRLQVANVRATLPRVAELFFSQPDRRLKVIGIVGSYGVPAPALLMKTILNAAGMKCGFIGASGCEAGERWMPALKKNAESLDYHEALGQMVRAGCGACVIELSPEAIEQKVVHEIAFDAMIFGRFDDEPVPGRIAALREFCGMLAKGPKHCVGVFDLDDATASLLHEARILRQQVSYGFDGGAEVRGSEVELAHGSLSMLVEAGAMEIRLRTKLTGRKNASNLLAACAGGLAMKIPLSLMRFTLQKTIPPGGELEPIGTAADLPIYIDGARTEPEIAEAIENVREITKGRVLVAVGSIGGESVERREKLGHTAAIMADYTIITTNNPGRESAAQIAAQVERGFQAGPSHPHHIHPYHIQLDRAQAIYDLVHMAQPGDAILITGKGRENHQEFADTIVPFDDREYAVNALETRNAPAPIELVRHPMEEVHEDALPPIPDRPAAPPIPLSEREWAVSA
jgi:UDP-N-acetylmuramoyl-L-alanyl-D-glutamate--2,6-diaminopimelate ligase